MPGSHHGVAAPGFPGLRRRQRSARGAGAALDTERLVQRHVAGGERVGPAQRAHGDVLRRPVADARQLLAVARGWRARRRRRAVAGVCRQRPGRWPRWPPGAASRCPAGPARRRRRGPAPPAPGTGAPSSGNGVSMASPKRSTSRCASVRAAATVICWPSTARTASSKPLSPPGTRTPSQRGKLACSTLLMPSGSASRSNAARTRRITCGNTSHSESLTRSSTWCCAPVNSATSHP